MTNLAKNFSAPNEKDLQISLNWQENPSIKKLLDVLVSILAEEYIETAKKNPKIFTK